MRKSCFYLCRLKAGKYLTIESYAIPFDRSVRNDCFHARQLDFLSPIRTVYTYVEVLDTLLMLLSLKGPVKESLQIVVVDADGVVSRSLIR